MAKILDYVCNPQKLIPVISNLTMQLSYTICLLVCIGSIMLYIMGCKKSGKWATMSLGIYTLIQAIGSALR